MLASPAIHHGKHAMFGKNKQRATAQIKAKNCRFSLLASDLVIKGNIASGADLHIDGRVEGDIECTGLTQGSDSHIVGNVTADSVKLGGTVEGSVKAKSVTIEPGARITGGVDYEVISVESGGTVDGKLKPVGAAIPATGPDDVRSIPAAGE